MAAKQKRKVGRPKQPPEQNRSEILMLRVTSAERKLLESVAGDNLSQWMRDVLLDEANRRAAQKVRF